MSSRCGILAAGNWIVDHTKIVDVYPAQDALANISEQHRSNGGSPFNLLVDLSRMGAKYPLMAAGLVGNDSDGRYVMERCKSSGIDAAWLAQTEAARTSYTDVMTVKKTGRRTFFHHRGANALFDGAEIDISKVGARLFHLGYLLLLDRLDEISANGLPGSAALLERALAAGMVTSVDVVSEDSDRFAGVVRPALPFTDILLLNDFEAERTTGISVRKESGSIDCDALRRAGDRLLGEGVRKWVIIHAPEGAAAFSNESEEVVQPSLSVSEEWIAGTSGAGDAFAAGVLHGIHEGWPMERSLLAGVCVAASCLSHPTTSGGVMPLEHCLQLAERFGIREGL